MLQNREKLNKLVIKLGIPWIRLSECVLLYSKGVEGKWTRALNWRRWAFSISSDNLLGILLAFLKVRITVNYEKYRSRIGVSHFWDGSLSITIWLQFSVFSWFSFHTTHSTFASWFLFSKNWKIIIKFGKCQYLACFQEPIKNLF